MADEDVLTCRWWIGASGLNPATRALLRAAKRGDAIWDPECELLLNASSNRRAIRSMCLELVVAEANGRPIGFGITKRFTSETWVIEIFVARRYRGRRIASAILRAIVARAAAKRATCLVAEFERKREASRRLMAAAEFELKGTLVYPGSLQPVEYWIADPKVVYRSARMPRVSLTQAMHSR